MTPAPVLMKIRRALLVSAPLLLGTTWATASHFYAGLYASPTGILELHRTPEGALLRATCATATASPRCPRSRS